MIEVENLSKLYGSKLAVDNISFSAQDGEILGFLGHNGAGKSTTMNILTGYISASSGRALINGIDILKNPIAAKTGIGYLPELPPLYMEMTVTEYLRFIYSLKKSKLKREPHINEICEIVKVTNVKNRVIRNLSKGYKQRVGLAGTLIGNPKTIILDEPTVGLDPSQIIEIRSLIKRLGSYHTVVFSSHILSEIQSVCDRVVIINKGKIIADAKTEALAKSFSNLSEVNLTLYMNGKTREEIEDVIKTIPNFVSITVPKTTKEVSDEIEFLTVFEKDTDMRRELSRALLASDIPIVGMKANEPSLEEIFIKLTNQSDFPFSEEEEDMETSKSIMENIAYDGMEKHISDDDDDEDDDIYDEDDEDENYDNDDKEDNVSYEEDKDNDGDDENKDKEN